MQGFLDWLSRYSHWLVLLLLEGGSLALLVSFNRYQGSVWFTGANYVVGRVEEWRHGMMSYIYLGERNRELTERNIQLERELEVLRAEVAELAHDSSYTERAVARRLQSARLLPARVISNSIRLSDNYLTIDRGARDGVRPKMGVVCGTGIVGIVSHVTDRYSVVMSILNSKSGISCRIRGNNYFGYLHWQGGNVLTVQLDDIPRHASCKVGDVVETSGFSNVFPAGIFVGRVMQIRDSKDGLSYQLLVQLSSDLANLRDVAVILDTPGMDDVEEHTR